MMKTAVATTRALEYGGGGGGVSTLGELVTEREKLVPERLSTLGYREKRDRLKMLLKLSLEESVRRSKWLFVI